MKTECGQDMKRGKTIHFSEIQLTRSGDYLGMRVMKEDKWKTISGEKENFCPTGIQNDQSQHRKKNSHSSFCLSPPCLLILWGRKRRASDGEPSLSSWPTASWGQGMLCVSFQRDKENWVNGEKLTNSFGPYSNGSPLHLERSTNCLFQREISVDFGKLFSCWSGNVMRDVLNNGKCAVIWWEAEDGIWRPS